MANKIAVVSGASRGIGRAVAKGLASDGWHVCLVARNEQLLEEVIREICEGSGSATAYPYDLSNISEISKLRSEIEKDVGSCDLLFNSAGVWAGGLFDVTTDAWEALVTTNVTAPLFMMKEFAHLLRGRQGATIINMCSIGAREGSSRTGAYGATKRALLSVSESAYKLLAKDGIKVVAICPSWTSTDMAEQAGTPYSSADMISPQDILETVRWILRLSPAAAIREVFIDCQKDVR